MKTIKHIGILLSVLLLNLSLAKAQDRDACMLILRNAYDHLMQAEATADQEVYASYSIVNYNKDGSRFKDAFIQIVSDDYYITEGQHMQYYADRKWAVTILQDQKQIIITSSNKTEETNNPFEQFWNIIETQSKQISCIQHKDTQLIEINIKMTKTGVIVTEVSSVSYIINKETYEIKEMLCHYKKGHGLLRTKYKLQEIKARPKQKEIPAIQRIYNTQSVLKSAYKDFKISDYRK